MGKEDLKTFCAAHEHLKGEALTKELSLKVEHHRKLQEQEENRRTRIPQPLSVLKNKGYTDEHLKSIAEVCDSEWNPEIKDRIQYICS